MAKRPKAEKPARAKQPKPQDLPGMEDRAIKALEEPALEYAEIRDARMDLNRREVDLKKRLRGEMKRLNRTRYEHEGIVIELIPPGTEEDVKVRIRKQAEDVVTD